LNDEVLLVPYKISRYKTLSVQFGVSNQADSIGLVCSKGDSRDGMREEVIAGWIKQNNESLRDLYTSLSTTFPRSAMASSFTRILDHKIRSTTVGKTPLDE
jgi:hypothetical protein